ncbi:MAG: SURF1 family protein [Nocardioidaceae bacterium]
MSALLSPRMLALHVVALAAIGTAVLLGTWQYDVWADHRHDQAAKLAHQAPRPLDDLLGPDDPFSNDAVGRPVTFTGNWDAAHTTTVTSGAGEWVVTPVRIGDSAILVARGSTTPGKAAAPVSGQITVTGWLQPSADAGDETVGVRVADFVQEIDTDLYSGYVIARTPQDPGLAPITPDQLPEADSFTSIRNLLYALEWWVFAGFAGFIWWRWCRDEVARVRAGAPTQDAPTAPAA